MRWSVNLPKDRHEGKTSKRKSCPAERYESTHLEDNILAKPHISVYFQGVQIDDTWDSFEALQEVTNLCPQERLAQVSKRYHHNGAKFCRTCYYFRTQQNTQ